MVKEWRACLTLCRNKKKSNIKYSKECKGPARDREFEGRTETRSWLDAASRASGVAVVEMRKGEALLVSRRDRVVLIEFSGAHHMAESGRSWSRSAVFEMR